MGQEPKCGGDNGDPGLGPELPKLSRSQNQQCFSMAGLSKHVCLPTRSMAAATRCPQGLEDEQLVEAARMSTIVFAK